MFDKNFDPYDILVKLNERLHQLEIAHNTMAVDYQKTQHELNIALQSLNSLQRGHLALSELVASQTLINLDKKG